jgi:hypothetical protein
LVGKPTHQRGTRYPLPACEIETTEDAHVMRRGKFGPAREVVMARSRFDDPIEPMTLSNMRENGVRCRSLSGVSKVAWPIRHMATSIPPSLIGRMMSSTQAAPRNDGHVDPIENCSKIRKTRWRKP